VQTEHNLPIVHRWLPVTEFFASLSRMTLGFWGAFWQQFRRLPLYYRVLLANILVIVLGALGGTLLATWIGRDPDQLSTLPLFLCITVIGAGLSIAVNVLLLHAAFKPLTALHRTAVRVQAGDLSARVPIDTATDPEMARLATTFNATLEELQAEQQQMREMTHQVIRAQEEERRRISRELHDDTAQVLFAQLLQVAALKSLDEPKVDTIAGELETSTVHAIEGVRRLALELRPPALDDLGLEAALNELCHRFRSQNDCTIDLHVSGLRNRLATDVELVLYRIAQEALTNIGKHAKAKSVYLDLVRKNGSITLTIRDDGVGFEEGRFTASDGVGLGLGLFGMEERAELIGGTLRIRSAPQNGTVVRCDIPYEGPVAA
jgi:two-component system sensor histidine kinase UhpB